MNTNTEPSQEAVLQRILMLLFEAQDNSQLQKVKTILGFFLNTQQNGIPKLTENDILLVKVEPNAILLKSQKILEKGFPMVYFIQARKFMGHNELFSSTNKLADLVKLKRQDKEALDALNSFFRGCTMFYSQNALEALNSLTQVKDSNPTSKDVQIPYASQIIEKSVWAARWSWSSAWGVASSLITGQPDETQNNTDSNNNANQIEHIDIVVVRYNWYNRMQKRLYRFFAENFQRIDPEGSPSGGELVKATYEYSDVERLTLEKGIDLAIQNNVHSVQWISTPEAVKIVDIIVRRAPWTATIIVQRNLEMQMRKHFVNTIQLQFHSKIMSTPRWSKDNLSLAIEEESSWKHLNLEVLDALQPQIIVGYDPIHHTDGYLKENRSLKVASGVASHLASLTKENLEKDFLECAMSTINYVADGAIGVRSQISGCILECINSISSEKEKKQSVLFFTKTSDFNSQWKIRHTLLRLFDVALSLPVMSSDGKFIAAVDENNNTLYIHTVAEFNQVTYQMFETHGIDPEDVLFDAKKPAKKSKVVPPSFVPTHPQATSGSPSDRISFEQIDIPTNLTNSPSENSSN